MRVESADHDVHRYIYWAIRLIQCQIYNRVVWSCHVDMDID